MRWSLLYPTLLLSPILALASPTRLHKRLSYDGDLDVTVPELKDLTPDDFDSTVAKGYWFVKHFSPYCGHCKKAAPIWQALYEFYATSSPASPSSPHPNSPPSFTDTYDWHFANVDCSAHGDMCTEHAVTAYPTFQLWKDGKQIAKFEGKRNTIELLSEFMEEQLEKIKPGSRPAKLELPEPLNTSDFALYMSRVSEKKNSEPTAAPSPKKTIDTSAKDEISKKKGPPANPDGVSVNFDVDLFQKKVIDSKEGWFVKFYAPWCSHCQAMAPAWTKLASQMQNSLNVGEVNCEVERRLCKEANVGAYPTILFFKDGDRVEYKGLRGLGDLVSWAQKAADSGIKEIGDAADFEAIQKKHEVIFLYFYDHATVSEDFEALSRIAMPLIGHAPIYKTNSDHLARKYRITTRPQLVVLRDDTPSYYPALSPADIRDTTKMVDWMKTVWLPTVPELSASNSHEIMNSRTVVLGIFDTSNKAEFETAKAEMKEAAKIWAEERFQEEKLERQGLRDQKKKKINEAKDNGDQKKIDEAEAVLVTLSEKKNVGFAWVDGVFWDKWVKQTYNIDVKEVGNRVIVNEEDKKRYWDSDEEGQPIQPSRSDISDIIKVIMQDPYELKSKSTVGAIERAYMNAKDTSTGHPYLTLMFFVASAAAVYFWRKGKQKRTYQHHAGMGLNPGNMKDSGWSQGWFGGEKDGFFGNGNGGGGKYD